MSTVTSSKCQCNRCCIWFGFLWMITLVSLFSMTILALIVVGLVTEDHQLASIGFGLLAAVATLICCWIRTKSKCVFREGKNQISWLCADENGERDSTSPNLLQNKKYSEEKFNKVIIMVITLIIMVTTSVFYYVQVAGLFEILNSFNDVGKSKINSNPDFINELLDMNGDYQFKDKYYTNNNKLTTIQYKTHWLYDAELYKKYEKYISFKQPNTFGIVSSGANLHDLHMIYTQITILFELNNKYDVEIFVDKNVNNSLLKQCKYIFTEQVQVKKYNFSIKCVEIDVLNVLNKPNVIIQSSFQHILFLDANNICLRNPTILFDSQIYKKYEAIFWPDWYVAQKIWCQPKNLWMTSIHPDEMSSKLYMSLNLTYDNNEIRFQFSLESGEILIDSIQNAMALLLTIDCWDGDRDCFKLSFLKAKSLFYIVPRTPYRILGGLLNTYITTGQLWIDNQLLFIHGFDTFYCWKMFTFLMEWDGNYDCNKRLNTSTSSIFLPFTKYHIKYTKTKNKMSNYDSLSIQRLELLYHQSYDYVCSLVFSEDCECVYLEIGFIKFSMTAILLFICFMYSIHASI